MYFNADIRCRVEEQGGSLWHFNDSQKREEAELGSLDNSVSLTEKHEVLVFGQFIENQIYFEESTVDSVSGGLIDSQSTTAHRLRLRTCQRSKLHLPNRQNIAHLSI
jgi:hypothetical protein